MLAALAAPPASAATDDEVEASVAAGVSWLRSQQAPTGAFSGFGGDYALSALSAAGVHPADVGSPSAQDFAATQFAGLTAPSSTAVLFGHAAGIDTQRLSATTNLVAMLAGAYNPTGELRGSFGNGAGNIAGFTMLALARVGGPPSVLAAAHGYLRDQQHDDGGWSFGRVATDAQRAAASSVDATGYSLAALCETGAAQDDPAVRRGVALLRGRQDPATGGFGNVDSTAWAISGLNACGLDAGSARFATASGHTPQDALLALQLAPGAAGAGAWTFGGAANLYATQNAVRALAGEAFSAEPPRRLVAADPRLRPPATVAAGVVTPHALAIDDGAGDVRFCRVDVAAGATLEALLGRSPGRLDAGRLRDVLGARRRRGRTGQRRDGHVAPADRPPAAGGRVRGADTGSGRRTPARPADALTSASVAERMRRIGDRRRRCAACPATSRSRPRVACTARGPPVSARDGGRRQPTARFAAASARLQVEATRARAAPHRRDVAHRRARRAPSAADASLREETLGASAIVRRVPYDEAVALRLGELAAPPARPSASRAGARRDSHDRAASATSSGTASTSSASQPMMSVPAAAIVRARTTSNVAAPSSMRASVSIELPRCRARRRR